MTAWSARLRLGLFSGLTTVVVVAVGFRSLKADPEATGNNAAAEEVVAGVQHCAYCHDHSGPPVAPLAKQGVATFDEVGCWRARDWHQRAAQTLTSKTGRAISVKLYKDPGAAASKAECLNCHGVSPTVETNLYDATGEGVTCTVCHGTQEKWLRHHWLDKDWRSKRTDKEFGMIDLAHPVVRAQRCASCHVGNMREGKVVTHPMYAAGHPPLPPFESVSYADQMPPHWKTIEDPELRKERGLGDASTTRSRDALLGVIATFQTSMELLSESAGPGQNWPKFEQFDCYACHHDLRVESWRQRRGDVLAEAPARRPGRPRPREWELSYLEAIAQALDPRDAEVFAARRDDLIEAFHSRPFGDPAQVASAATKLADWSRGALDRLERTPVDQAWLRGVLTGLCTSGQSSPLDRDAARQLAWLIVVMAREAAPSDATVTSSLEELSNLFRLEFQQDKSTTETLFDSRIAGDYIDREEFETVGEPERFKEILREIVSALAD